MGIHTAPSRMTGISTYYVTDTTQEDLGDGNVFVRNYRRRNGILVPEFNCIIASPNLLRASTRFLTFVRTINNKGEWRDVGAKVH